MKAFRFVSAALFATALTTTLAWAGDTYQVTGPVLSVTDSTIVVQKGDEKWELAKDAATQVKGGDIKVGTKVTVKYRMTAVSIDVKDAAKK
jgi:hypothetical protein